MTTRSLLVIAGFSCALSQLTCDDVKGVFQAASCCGAPGTTEVASHCTGRPGLLSGAKAHVDAEVAKLVPSSGAAWHVYKAQRGDSVIEGTYGVGNWSMSDASPPALSRFYSSTKLMVHTMLMKFWEDGLVHLDMPLSRAVQF